MESWSGGAEAVRWCPTFVPIARVRASEGFLTGADYAIAVADFAIPKVSVPVRLVLQLEDLVHVVPSASCWKASFRHVAASFYRSCVLTTLRAV